MNLLVVARRRNRFTKKRKNHFSEPAAMDPMGWGG